LTGTPTTPTATTGTNTTQIATTAFVNSSISAITKVNVSSTDSNTSYYIPFVSASGNQNLYIDDTTTPSLKYNPNGTQLSCENIVGVNLIMTGNITANTGLISLGIISSSGLITANGGITTTTMNSSGLITADSLTVNKPITLQISSPLIAPTSSQLGYSVTVGNSTPGPTYFVIGGAYPNNYKLLATIIGTAYPIGVYLITGSVTIQGYMTDIERLYYVGLSLSSGVLNDGFGNTGLLSGGTSVVLACPYFIPIKNMAIGTSGSFDTLFFNYVHTVSSSAGATGLYIVINGPTAYTNTRYSIINYQITRIG